MLNSHENNGYFHRLLHGNDNNYVNDNDILEDGVLDNYYNRHGPFPSTNTIIPSFTNQPFQDHSNLPYQPFSSTYATSSDNLVFNYQQFQNHTNLLYQPPTSMYFPGECSSNSVSNYLQDNQQGMTQPGLHNFPYNNDYCFNLSFAQNKNDNFM